MALFAGLLLDLSNMPVWLRWLDFFSIIKYVIIYPVLPSLSCPTCLPAHATPMAADDHAWLLLCLCLRRYGYQLFVYDQYHHTELSCMGQLICLWPTGDAVMRYVGTRNESATRNVLLLVGLSVFFRVLSFFFLSNKVKRRGLKS